MTTILNDVGCGFSSTAAAAGGIFCAPASRKGSNLSSPVKKSSLGPILTLMIRFDVRSQFHEGKEERQIT